MLALYAVGGLAAWLGFLLGTNDVPSVPKPCFKYAELEGEFAPNNDLLRAQTFGEGQLQSPETVIVAPDGETLLTCRHDGSVVTVHPNGSVGLWAYVGGRALGGAFDKNGDLILAECQKGLVKVDKTTRQVTVLAAQAGGQPINYADDITIAEDGKIYFSDASAIRVPVDFHNNLDIVYTAKVDFTSGVASGRLLAYDPSTLSTSVLATGLYFANGVTLTANQDAVLVAETGAFRVSRHWLKGPKAGKTDIFVEGLPGTPDGVKVDATDGSVYVAIYTLVTPLMKAVCGWQYPALQTQVQNFMITISGWASIPTTDYGLILHYSADGKLIRTLQDPHGTLFKHVTSVTPHGDKLLIGNIGTSHIGVMDKWPAKK
eukprot:comp22545_c0_seq1/m.34280 comp22545_c0_seq1/g.34280  ORF comp22545_c0_seq1/g.34280 comp22545_c0_seq1/m.34280 type:complete len:374 (-) comp22545_c0_seq1:418-1539(-)